MPEVILEIVAMRQGPALTGAISVFLAGSLSSQSLSFWPPPRQVFRGPGGEPFTGTYRCRLDMGFRPGLSGWTIGVVAERAREASITTTGRAGDLEPVGFRRGDFYLDNCSPSLVDCLLVGNRAPRGGAITFDGHSLEILPPVLVGCTIEGNFAENGGAAFCYHSCT